MASRTLYDVSALFVGLGRVGVVRRAYRSSVNNTQDALRHFFIIIFFLQLLFLKDSVKGNFVKSAHRSIHELRWKDFLPISDHAAFASPRFVRTLICLQIFFFYRKTENLLFVVKGKCTTVI